MADIKRIALNIYEESKDMDFADYEETKPADVAGLMASLEALQQDENHAELFKALQIIFDN